MAAGDFVTSARQKIRQGDVAQGRANSEAVQQKISGNINFILDRAFYEEKFVMNGFFTAGNFDDGVGGIRRIMNDVEISSYYMSVFYTGNGGSNIFNCAIYDSAGAFVNNLFGSGANRIIIGGQNKNRVVLGRDAIDTVSPTTFETNTTGVTIQYGNLNVTTLLAGWILVPFVEGNGVNARNLVFNMRLKEI